MTDFEKGLQNAIQKELAINLRLNGCWFHSSQAIQRKAVKIFGKKGFQRLSSVSMDSKVLNFGIDTTRQNKVSSR